MTIYKVEEIELHKLTGNWHQLVETEVRELLIASPSHSVYMEASAIERAIAKGKSYPQPSAKYGSLGLTKQGIVELDQLFERCKVELLPKHEGMPIKFIQDALFRMRIEHE